MKVCPVCQTTDVHASHRRGWLERRPLTWVGILPFRCGACQTRYYRFALADARRRHGGLIVSHSERERPPRWRLQSRTRITVHQQGRTSLSVAGETENVSALGVRLRLPTEIAVGSKVELVVQSGAPRGGIVRWHTPDQTSGHVYGVEFDRPLERKAQASRPLGRLRRRRMMRHLLLGCAAVGAMAIIAAGMVWLMEAMRTYNPQYYEPKDVEREQHATMQTSGEQPRSSVKP